MARSKKELNEKYQSPFASRLRELMDTNKMTQDTLAQKIGKTRQTVSQYANGDSEPGYSTLVKIAEIFNTTTDYLLGVTNAKSISTDERTIIDKIGLSSQSIHLLEELSVENSATWGIDVFNAIIEHKKFPLLLGLVTEATTLKNKSERLSATNLSKGLHYSGNIMVHDVLRYQIQTILSEIIQDITPQFESKDDYRWMYNFVYSLYKEDKLTKEEYEYHRKKLDSGDYSEFPTEVKNDG